MTAADLRAKRAALLDLIYTLAEDSDGYAVEIEAAWREFDQLGEE